MRHSNGEDKTIFSKSLHDAVHGHLLHDKIEEAYAHAKEAIRRYEVCALSQPEVLHQKDGKGDLRSEATQTQNSNDIRYDVEIILQLRDFVAAVDAIKRV